MNILMFADLVGTGGTEQAFRVLVNELMKDGHKVTLIASRPTPGYTHVVIPQAFADNPFPFVAKTLQKGIQTILDANKFDVLVYGLMFNYGLIRFARRYGIPAIRYLHVASCVCPNNQKYRFGVSSVCNEAFGLHCVVHRKARGCHFDGGRKQYSFLGFLRSLMTNYAARYWDSRLDRIVANSEYVRFLYIQSGYPKDRLVLSYPPNRFLGMGTAKNVSKEKFVLYSGRIEGVKGLSELQQILAQLPENVKLHVAGVGGQVDELQQFAQKRNLKHKLVYLGFLQDIELKEQLELATVCVMPSHLPETYGLSGAEAIALGTPVVAYDVGGVREWLVSDQHGKLVSPESSEKFVSSVLEILGAPWRVHQDSTVVSSGRRYVNEFYQYVHTLLNERGETQHGNATVRLHHH
ncbi:glycosyltransferase family 4 protein [Alicyclobacillus ferrooxydans]|uniref:Glycosyl transferase family 1 domain-containing protein n=1 Tax=Alicyclobacillus ferrooxydans TaxID=471514 RepID=A0A0P9C7Y8_9BACL|nr:glycosyltransferase family 4 protein [Alicyclobacillus ferrooxydans]KPV39323.1 hypothetical protein AN477_22770 [Alicyclobacillus ferrooxydans]